MTQFQSTIRHGSMPWIIRSHGCYMKLNMVYKMHSYWSYRFAKLCITLKLNVTPVTFCISQIYLKQFKFFLEHNMTIIHCFKSKLATIASLFCLRDLQLLKSLTSKSINLLNDLCPMLLERLYIRTYLSRNSK